MIRHLYIGKTNARKFKRCIKIGIATDTDQRWKDIDRSVKGSREWVIFSGPVLFAAKIEKMLHRRYGKYRVRFKGSGKTEWFRLPVLLRIKVVFSIMAYIFLTWAAFLVGVFLILKAILV